MCNETPIAPEWCMKYECLLYDLNSHLIVDRGSFSRIKYIISELLWDFANKEGMLNTVDCYFYGHYVKEFSNILLSNFTDLIQETETGRK